MKSLITEIKIMIDLSPISKWEWLKFNIRKNLPLKKEY